MGRGRRLGISEASCKEARGQSRNNLAYFFTTSFYERQIAFTNKRGGGESVDQHASLTYGGLLFQTGQWPTKSPPAALAELESLRRSLITAIHLPSRSANHLKKPDDPRIARPVFVPLDGLFHDRDVDRGRELFDW